MHAMKIHARSEKIAVSRKGQGGEISTPAAAPDADFLGVDVGPRGQPSAAGKDVAIFRSTIAPRFGSLAKSATVIRAAAVIHGKHGITVRGKLLISHIAVVIIVERVKCRQHLSAWPAMGEDKRWGQLGLESCASRAEELRVDLDPVAGFERHVFRR